MKLPRGEDFRPPWPLTSGHLQTMLSMCTDSPFRCNFWLLSFRYFLHLFRFDELNIGPNYSGSKKIFYILVIIF